MARAPADPFWSRACVDVDLDAACANFRMLADGAPGAETAAVVKCDGYGLGAGPIARALAERENCRTFFVTYPEEGAALRMALANTAHDAVIYIFNGPSAENAILFARHSLTPVLNTLAQAELWSREGGGAPVALHIETGMNRLGAAAAEIAAIAAIGIKIDLVLSHLACASDPGNEMNERQRALFEKSSELFPGVRRCLAASGGALIGPVYHYELIRPGAALYGISPFDRPDPRLEPVASLSAPVVQLRSVHAGETTGYGASKRFEKDARLATVALGYGDGFPRAAGNCGSAFLGGDLSPIVGRVSMDIITLDVTNAPQTVEIGDRAEFFGRRHAIEDAAAACGTIGYELLAGLGARLPRRYLSSGAVSSVERSGR